MIIPLPDVLSLNQYITIMNNKGDNKQCLTSVTILNQSSCYLLSLYRLYDSNVLLWNSIARQHFTYWWSMYTITFFLKSMKFKSKLEFNNLSYSKCVFTTWVSVRNLAWCGLNVSSTTTVNLFKNSTTPPILCLVQIGLGVLTPPVIAVSEVSLL